MGDHERGVVPLVELGEELRGRLRHLDAVRRERPHRDARRAALHVPELGPVADLVESAPPGDQRKPHRLQGAQAGAAQTEGRRDGPGRDALVLQIAQHHVLVAVVLLGIRRLLGPLPAQVGNQVRICRVAGQVVALANRSQRLLPVIRREALGVIVDGEEVERGAEAREVARVRGRVGARGVAQHGQAEEEGIRGERGVDVQVAEEDLAGGLGPDRARCLGHVGDPAGHGLGRPCFPGDTAGSLVAPQVAAGRGQDQQDNQGQYGDHG